MPASFEGWDFNSAYSQALAKKAGRAMPLVVGNDGAFGGVGEAQRVRGTGTGGVHHARPGSGLGHRVHRRERLALQGDTLAGMETAHMPAALHLLGAKPYPCGCGRTWGCVELYTTLGGLPLPAGGDGSPAYPDHPLASSTQTPKEKALGAARPGAEGRRARRRAVRFSGARDGAAHRQPGAGAGSASSS